jgi:ATP-dependent protease Clp ATPase subunit
MKCSFCGRRESEVQKLVAGPKKLAGRVYICDRCATEAVLIMETRGIDPSCETIRTRSWWSRFFACSVVASGCSRT